MAGGGDSLREGQAVALTVLLGEGVRDKVGMAVRGLRSGGLHLV